MAATIDLGGYSVTAGDGILLEGKTLYVVRNQLNLIAEIKLAPDHSSGSLVDEHLNPNFDIPTTLDRFGDGLYVVNARFSFGHQPRPYLHYRPRGAIVTNRWCRFRCRLASARTSSTGSDWISKSGIE